MDSFYTTEELNKLGLKHLGKNVLISRKCSIYGAENISLGNNVRIDDFCILSGNIEIGSYVHISAYNVLYGSGGILISDFSGISARSTLYSAIDDFSGEYMISPLIPDEYRNVKSGKIILEKYVQIGANSIIMPEVCAKEGSVCGAFSFVNNDLEEWTINVGIPAKFLKKRSKNILNLSKEINND